MLSTGLIFYPWFKFYFPLFLTHYHTLPYPKTRENKFKLRIKLNHNVYVDSHKFMLIFNYIFLLHLKMTLERSKCYDFYQGCQKVFKQQADIMNIVGSFGTSTEGYFENQSLGNGISRGFQELTSTVNGMLFCQNTCKTGNNAAEMFQVFHDITRFEHFTDLNLFLSVQCHSKLGNVSFTILFVVYAKRRGKQAAKDG